jgi:hypothetical protein
MWIDVTKERDAAGAKKALAWNMNKAERRREKVP